MNYLIISWLASALLSWTPAQGNTQDRTDKLNSIASDIVDIVYHEPVTFHGPYAHAQMALLVGSVGTLESRYEDRIQEGHCKKGECDGGRAFCYMQIHARSGILPVENEREVSFSRDGLIGEDLLESQRDCLHVGVHMIRRALRFSRNQNLRAYTGETGIASPESDARFALVREYMKKSPPPLSDADFTSADTDMQKE